MTSRVQSFTTRDPELNRKLVQFENSVYALFAASEKAQRFEVPAPVFEAGYIARPGQLVRVMKAVEVLLAAPRVSEAGLPLVIWNRSGGTVTVRPIEGTINGAGAASLAGARAYRVEHDGSDYAGEF